MKFKDISIGKGINISIAKAGLVLYYWLIENSDYFTEESFFDYGELPYVHEIVSIAGAKQKSFYTPSQVINN